MTSDLILHQVLPETFSAELPHGGSVIVRTCVDGWEYIATVPTPQEPDLLGRGNIYAKRNFHESWGGPFRDLRLCIDRVCARLGISSITLNYKLREYHMPSGEVMTQGWWEPPPRGYLGLEP